MSGHQSTIACRTHRFGHVGRTKSTCGFLSFWNFPRLVLLCLFSHFCRIGEAAVPGPNQPSHSSFMDSVPWNLSTGVDFCIGTCNPSGISNKHHIFREFPIGWWHVAETQASKYQQCKFQKMLSSVSYQQERNVRSCLGAPAPYRPGSTVCGAWTGVLNFGDCAIRHVPCVWPSGEFDSGRALISVGFVGGLEIAAATVYCPPKGPTFPKATELCEKLLQPITEQIVFGRQGCRVILGDFNNACGSLSAMREWQAQGWVELQQLFQSRYSVPPIATCKGATCPDQIWLSPEIVPYVVNSAVWDIFPDHCVVIAGLRLPKLQAFSQQWPLPGRIPWDAVDFDLWESDAAHSFFAPDFPTAPSVDDMSEAFRAWGDQFEQKAASCLSKPVAKADRSFQGRGKLTAPVTRRNNHLVVKSSRQGEYTQVCGFLNRAVSRWFKQLRRFQSYHHAIASPNAASTYASRLQLWISIRKASGFQNGFVKWWFHRPFKMQGSPESFPQLPPSLETAQRVLEDFHMNYQRFEHWQNQKRLASCKAKAETNARSIYATCRKPSKPSLDTIEDVVEQPISLVDAQAGIVAVPHQFPTSHIRHWTLQGQPAWVLPDGHNYRVGSDLLLCEGQTLACHVVVHDEKEIHQRLAKLWSPRWNKLSDIPPDRWAPIVDFARRTLTPIEISLPPVNVQMWRKAISHFKSSAATGPCGWTRSDMINMTDGQITSLLELFRSIENGNPWPKQLCVGLIHCLHKKNDSYRVDAFRPITLCSIWYRAYAGIRAGQILSQLNSHAEYMQCGYVRHKQSADIWHFIGVCLEVAIQQHSPVHGVVADLVKAFNTLPRGPTFEFLRILGTPEWFLDMWQRHLASFARHFVVNRIVSSEVASVTGYPEGCPLSCIAMTVIDKVWHCWQLQDCPRCLPLSYVDNLELVCDRIPDLITSVTSLRSFCLAMDLQLDEQSFYAWSSCATTRHELKLLGFRISLGARDLGGQVIYCNQLRNKVLTDRIESVLEYFKLLRKSGQSVAVRKVNLKQVLWPRALHGSEAVVLGDAHIAKLQSGAMKALGWDRAGASPVSRLELLHTLDVDPRWHQFWLTIKLFIRQCRASPVVADWWKIFCTSYDGSKGSGPFHKLWLLLSDVGLQLDDQFRLWFSENGFISLLWFPIGWLEKMLLYFFHSSASARLANRAGFHDLDGFDFSLTTWVDAAKSPVEREQLNLLRDGSFVTNDMKAKFDKRISKHCLCCGVIDTLAHRYRTCPKYQNIRDKHCRLMQVWDSLPTSFQLHGLVPQNPWQTLLWEAFLALPDTVTDFAFNVEGDTVHCFTDGTCSSPTDPTLALAAWAVVVPFRGTLSCGVLKGVAQTILRSETTAVLSALEWGKSFTGSLHLWTDNQTVVDQVRAIQQGLVFGEDVEHPDLWMRISSLLQTTVAKVFIHKVASHDDEANCQSPLEDFCRLWNGRADEQAAISNLARPSSFQRIWDHYHRFRQLWKQHVQWHSSFVLDIAAYDLSSSKQPDDDEDFQQVSPIDFDRHSNTAEVSVQLSPFSECTFQLCSTQDERYQSVFHDLIHWMIHEDSSASSMRYVSLLEIYVAFRCSRQGCFSLCVGTHESLYHVVTFASDFTYFKKIFRHIFRSAGIQLAFKEIDLTRVNIVNPQPAICMGWCCETETCVFGQLQRFIGNRPVSSSQGLARPWRP